jgi:hypothetical protein
VGGLGAGKTWGGSAWLTLEHLKYPGVDSLGIEPTHSLLREVMIPEICQRLTDCEIEHDVNLSLMAILTPELGSKILLRSATRAEHITGFEVGRTWVDEPGRMPEHSEPKRNIWLACLGRTRSPQVPANEHRIAATGTHEGKGTWFWNKWEKDPKPGYQVYRAPTTENPSMAEQVAIYMREFGPELAEQYVRGYAVEDSLAAVPYALLEALQDDRASERDLDSLKSVGGPLFVGMDIGRSKSLTVFWVVSLWGDGELVTEGVITQRKTQFSKQFDTIEALVALPGFAGMAIDATYNPQTAEDAVNAFGMWKRDAHGDITEKVDPRSQIQPVIFTSPVKRQVTQFWIKACQDRRLRIPRSEDVLMDFFSVKRVVSTKGVVTYQAPFTADGHADRASACSLAVWASRQGPQEVSYQLGPPLRASTMKGL